MSIISFLSSLKDAWNDRHSLGSDNNSRELAAFLPAALEIQQAPPNPLAKWLSRSLMILLVLAVAWAMIGEVNIVASAEGKIIPSSRVKQIQPIEKAIVKAILVTEGQSVTKGEALIELDSTLTEADEKKLTQERHSSQLQQAIIRGLLALLEKTEAEQISVNTDQLDLSFPADSTEQEQSLHKRLLWQQWQQYRSQKQTLQNTLAKTKQEQASSRAVVSKLSQTLPIIAGRSKKLKDLYSQNFVSETEYLQVEQQRIENTQDLSAERHRLQQLKAAEREVNQQLNTLTAQTKSENLSKLTELQRQIAALDEELTKIVNVNSNQILYAPVSGQVQELAVNTVGGVVTEAQQLMLIVPDEETLEVEVFLENKDIGFVQEDMEAEIKIHTFPFTKYGIIDGTVTSISDDATVDEQRGLIYGMHLVMKDNTIWVEGKEVRLMPGMAVTAEMRTGKRRIIEFFLAPLLRYKDESIRER